MVSKVPVGDAFILHLKGGEAKITQRERGREREAMSRDENVFSLRASEGKSHRKLKTCTLSASKRRVAQMGIKSEEKHLSPHYK